MPNPHLTLNTDDGPLELGYLDVDAPEPEPLTFTIQFDVSDFVHEMNRAACSQGEVPPLPWPAAVLAHKAGDA